LIFTVR
jgi:hypothetical protein